MGLFLKKSNINKEEDIKTPKHIAIIMDGNGRWAKKRHLPRESGHIAGASTFKKIVKYCSKIGIEYCTVFAFSTENWKRPKNEVEELMKLFRKYLKDALKDFREENIKLKFLGEKKDFSEEIQKLMLETEILSQKSTGMTLNIAMNYGSKSEIVRATKLLINDIKKGKIKEEEVTEKTFSEKLYTYGQPDIDLVIRTSGEYRVSNFMLWQSAYAEYVIVDTLWPDFKPRDIDNAIKLYSSRNRRFGGV